MPQPTASPRHERATGCSTAASAGPMSSGPTNGLPTVRPCTSWSYWRTIASLDATFASPKARSSNSTGSIPAGSPGDGSTDRRDLDTFPGKDLLQRRPVPWRHGEHHSLLRFGEPDLPRSQTVVLEGYTRQIDVRSQLARHLADRRRKPARPAI